MEQHNDSKIRKILFNEISLIFALVGVIASAIFWISNPQQDMELEIVKLQSRVESYETVGTALQKIKDNDLHEIQLKMEQIESRQIEILESLAGVKVLLDEIK